MRIAAHELSANSTPSRQQIYNGYDCCLTYEVWTKLKELAPQATPAYDFELALQAPVLEMTLRGFKVDPASRQQGVNQTKAELAKINHVIQTLADAVWSKPLNPNSGPQLKSFFYDHLKIEPIKTWVKGELKYQMNREVLEKIEDHFLARPIVAAILAHRDLEKQLQVLETEVDPDWRMRTSYNIGGTKTGRFSSSKAATGTGTNLQNIAEGLRHILIPDPGYVLCGIDASQSDSRMVGYMCGLLFDDWIYLDACESSDLHTIVARMVWPHFAWTGDMKLDRKIADKPFYRSMSYRGACKRIGHGGNFLGKAQTLAKGSHAPLNLVKDFLARYFLAFPAIQQWQNWVAAELQTKRQLVSIHGRKRDFFDRTDASETIRKGLAFLAAAATADNLNLGMWRIWKFLPQVQLLAQVHDAVYFQFKETLDANEIISQAQELLKVELVAPNGRKFSIPTEAKLGYNWGEKSETNPRGLAKFIAKTN